MTNNPILDELHATRRKLLEESGGTLAGLVARLQSEQEASGRTILKTSRTKPSKSVQLPMESQSSPSGDR
jgi:hypothetical protein